MRSVRVSATPPCSDGITQRPRDISMSSRKRLQGHQYAEVELDERNDHASACQPVSVMLTRRSLTMSDTIEPTHVRLKRAYEIAERTDGRRILVDRLWPRGVSTAEARIDEWLK